MVLEEAKILNKPILITNTAARESIINYNKGQVIENSEEAIYEGLKEIIKIGKDKIDLSSEQRYDNINLIKQIISLIER